MKYLLLLIPVLLSGCGTLKPVKDTSVTHLLDPVVGDRSLGSRTPAVAIG